ncbi:hypothetical protein P154DRAFT_522145 [Amniculicola lignicola CBS 123094]|uniref:RNA ligase domain-containing protein n=1 Tax=Amniculicola lignicola CBS 123094 TaxID=1392246 RepID=A0A6A5WIV6_9PLEO|nr:hypothetical protein P154DRAFT_522145 [Amniculicola lignicola CBS 123094]
MESPQVPSLQTPAHYFPKITNHVKEIVKTLRYIERKGEVTPSNEPIPIIGTVKLHGTHGDIVCYNDDTLSFHSRNTVLTPQTDNLGFCNAMIAPDRTRAIIALRDQIRTRWKSLNPDKELDPDKVLILAGEWIGHKVQKGVAISELSRRFVICSINVDGEWVFDRDYADIEAPKADIYNISRSGYYESILYPDQFEKTASELEPLADKIAARCPFAESFDVIGEGEGLVWKLVPYIGIPELWFKTKGGKFKPTFQPAPKKLAPGDSGEKLEQAKELATGWCSEARLEQGWDYLREKGLPQNLKGVGRFLKWVQVDILQEEKGYINDNEVDEKILKQEIIRIAKVWYVQRTGKE